MTTRGPLASPRALDAAGKIIQRQAAEWLARRQAQEFSAAEAADFAEWLGRDERHAAIFHEVESAWRRFDRLASYPQAADAAPDPDLLAPPRPRFPVPAGWAPIALAAAAAIAMGGLFWVGRPPAVVSARPAVVHASTGPQFMRLPDGSMVELNAGAVVTEHFTPTVRRLRLVRGEAHFSVTKDPTREFVVEADGVDVRAVGTAFNVRLQDKRVEVLVTEGTVRVAPPIASPRFVPGGAHPVPPVPAGTNSAMVSAGQRTIVAATPEAGASVAVVETLAPADIDRALAWQTSRFNFDAIPLAEVVQRLNRFSTIRKGAARLTIRDADLGALLVSGRVRSDNLESFVEALETSFGVVAERHADGEVVLHRARR